MQKLLQILLSILVILCVRGVHAEENKDWVLVFEDHFKKRSLDTRKWTPIPYVNYKGAEWRRYQSQDKKLFTYGGSSIKLWGRYGNYITQNNQDAPKDTYACAGIQSYSKFSFQYGKVEVKARFSCVQGCWPAIWMMPDVSPGGWPNGGEIDIMEHLNHETHFYQTIHLPNNNGKHMSKGISPHPQIKLRSGKASRRKNAPPPTTVSDWHVYGLIWTPDAITFTLDGKPTGTIKPNISSKWPFSKENNTFYLIIDQQIGGGWVERSGAKGIDQKTLSKKGAVLEIDYVKVYSDPKYKLKAPDSDKQNTANTKKTKQAKKKKKTSTKKAD